MLSTWPLGARSYALRLASVVICAVVADWGTKAVARVLVPRDRHRALVLGFKLVHLQRAGPRSWAITLVVGAVLILAACGGWWWGSRRSRRAPPIWLWGGLLIGGAASSLLERAVVGSTTEWLYLPGVSAVSLAYAEMLVGATGLFFALGVSRYESSSQPH